jgi:hypothetical protein
MRASAEGRPQKHLGPLTSVIAICWQPPKAAADSRFRCHALAVPQVVGARDFAGGRGRVAADLQFSDFGSERPRPASGLGADQRLRSCLAVEFIAENGGGPGVSLAKGKR